jgi:hypothetical protein
MADKGRPAGVESDRQTPKHGVYILKHIYHWNQQRKGGAHGFDPGSRPYYYHQFANEPWERLCKVRPTRFI